MADEGIEWVTASRLAEVVAEYDPNEIVSYNVYGKADVEFDLGYSITEEQFKKFITAFQNDDVLNEVRAAAWMEALEPIREEVEG
jgi:hypothetical protein